MRIFPHWLPPLAAWALLAISVMGAVDARHESRRLTRELAQQRDLQITLENERRALLLEYYAFADFSQIRESAASIGMRDPSAEDGTLVFLSPEANPNPDGNPNPNPNRNPEAAR